jgi:hypothetical protein
VESQLVIFAAGAVLAAILLLAARFANDPGRDSLRRNEERGGNVYIIMPPAPTEVQHYHEHRHYHEHVHMALPLDEFGGDGRRLPEARRALPAPDAARYRLPRVVSVDREQPQSGGYIPAVRLLTMRESDNRRQR